MSATFTVTVPDYDGGVTGDHVRIHKVSTNAGSSSKTYYVEAAYNNGIADPYSYSVSVSPSEHATVAGTTYVHLGSGDGRNMHMITFTANGTYTIEMTGKDWAGEYKNIHLTRVITISDLP